MSTAIKAIPPPPENWVAGALQRRGSAPAKTGHYGTVKVRVQLTLVVPRW